MIVAIKGRLESSTLFSAVVEAGGLFYEVNIPLTTAERLPKLGEEVMLYTEAVYREDSQALYGFATKSDRDFFKTIIEKVSGIGPKTALNMMSRMSVATLRDSIAMGDVATLSKCPGIGKKTAERLVLELKGTLTGSTGTSSAVAMSNVGESINTNVADAISALVALGLKLADADKYVRTAVQKLGDDASTESLVKFALSK
ncbi:MAG: Holliday junction branch migration protein RuvA [Opitutales bacterium]|nr:Holliday junction branch migration protein RuvA [Opitutales bacterium]MBR7106462.1 Holliday junction branch migration protein RuvA [Opitutales bacterium]